MGRSASIGLARNFKRLLEGEEIPKSEFSSTVRESLEACEAIRYRKSGGGWIAYAVPQSLEVAIKTDWNILDLDVYIEMKDPNRIQAAHFAGNSKARSSNPFKGIFARSIGCDLQIASETLGRSPRGTSHFICYDRISLVKCDCDTIVTIENVDSLTEFESCLEHFPNLPKKLLLVLRWGKENIWIKIAQRLSKPIYHFGDYDPKGIAIYLDEVLKNAPKARLLIPEKYEELLGSVGNASLFDDHHRYIERLSKVENEEAAKAMGPILKHRKGMEQQHLFDPFATR